MEFENVTEFVAGAEGLDLGIGESDTKVLRDFRQRHLFQIEKGKQSALIRRKMREQMSHLVGRGSRGILGDPIQQIRPAVGEAGERVVFVFPAKPEGHIHGDALKPMEEWFLWLPLRERAPGADEGILDHVFEIRRLCGKPVEHGCDGGLVFHDEEIEGIQIPRLSRTHEKKIFIVWRNGRGRRRHGKLDARLFRETGEHIVNLAFNTLKGVFGEGFLLRSEQRGDFGNHLGGEQGTVAGGLANGVGSHLRFR
jgi:hypothetical protein